MKFQPLYVAGSRLAGPVKPLLKQAFYRAVIHPRIDSHVAICNSIPKSGTNKLRIFLANYLYKYYVDRDTLVTYAMTDDIIPNTREAYLANPDNYKPRDKWRHVFKGLPYDDIINCHTTRFLEYFDGKLVFVYRNPLDYLVSFFYNQYKYRPELSDKFAMVQEIIDGDLGNYIRHYTDMQRIGAKRDMFSITYENMMLYPHASYRPLLEYLNIPVDVDVLDRAVRDSDIKVVRKEEEAAGPIHSRPGYKGFFTRSGEIGQWKSVFTPEDVARCRAILAEAGMSLDSFIIEPPTDTMARAVEAPAPKES
ncbi:sulfotransferase [Paramagnetospirillum caucaseum]|uniref:Sulfotransferase n=1 Tax=Paramagnetospirillum caucaseum TaxID=1244869 RepID=M2Y8C8_9PROT|nr:sulfotransferase domain-containing protein [Paramagnetospirillum caucaseum]EME69306.1 sulfotransferase [Paramagnetospirillum caucaseum]